MTTFLTRRRFSKQALRLQLDGRWREAISVYRDLIDGSCADAMTYRYLMECHIPPGKHTDSAQCAEDALAIRNDEFDLLAVAGQHWERLGRNDRALEYAERASQARTILTPAMPRWAFSVMELAGKKSNIDAAAVVKGSVERLNAEVKAQRVWVDNMLSTENSD